MNVRQMVRWDRGVVGLMATLLETGTSFATGEPLA